MFELEPVTAAHVQYIVERASVGVGFMLVRYEDGTLGHELAGSRPGLRPDAVVWSGELPDLGDGWEFAEDGTQLTDADAGFAAQFLNDTEFENDIE